MDKKRKISIRKILQVFVTLVVAATCIVAISSASQKQDDKKISGMKIHIKNKQYGFLDKEEIKRIILNNKNIDPYHTPVANLNIHQVESIVNSNPWVDDAQVFVDNEKVLHINVTQRVPVARLFEQNGNSYYLDNTLSVLPLSDRYIYYTTVVTNVPVLRDDSTSLSMKAQIATLVKFVESNAFWKAQVSQIIVNDNRMFELVPVLGQHKILIGDTARLQDKFDNLFVFYRRVLNHVGWDRYEVLDARFAGQVVASPALQWKPPTDKMLSNMNWVKSIVGTEPVEKKPVTVPSAVPAAAPVVANAAPVVAKPVVKTEKPQPVAAARPKKEEKVVAKPVVKKPEPKKELQAKKIEPKKPEQKKTKADVHNKPKEKKQAAPKEQPENQEKPKYIYQGN